MNKPKSDQTKTDDTDDTEGNSMRWSDAEVKHDVTPVVTKSAAPTDETDDTEGSGLKHV